MVVNVEGGNQFGFGVNSAERPNAANFWQIVHLDVALFFADDASNLIHLKVLAWEITHDLVYQSSAFLPDADAQAHDGIPVNAGHAFTRANAKAFRQCRYHRDLFIRVEIVHHKSLPE